MWTMAMLMKVVQFSILGIHMRSRFFITILPSFIMLKWQHTYLTCKSSPTNGVNLILGISGLWPKWACKGVHWRKTRHKEPNWEATWQASLKFYYEVSFNSENNTKGTVSWHSLNYLTVCIFLMEFFRWKRRKSPRENWSLPLTHLQ